MILISTTRMKMELPESTVNDAVAEIVSIHRLIDDFAAEMKKKMLKKFVEGYGGWDKLSCRKLLKNKLDAHVKKGDMVDVANLAAMIHNLES